MRKLLTVVFVLAFVTFAWAGWNHVETVFAFGDVDSVIVGGTGSYSGKFTHSASPHGVVIDPEGKIWVAMHDNFGPDQSGSPEFWGYNHSATVAAMDTCHWKPLYCFMPDGTPASFSPITMLSFPDGSTDTLFAESINNGSGKGISLDMDGNILLTAWSTVYRINSTTGEGMHKFTPSVMKSMTEAVQDPASGLVYVGYVSPGGQPLYLLDEELALIGNAIDTTTQIMRSIVVRTVTDGTHLYTGSTWNGRGVLHWFSADPEFEAFTPVDTLGNSADALLWAESLDWTPDGNILVGSLRNSYAGALGDVWWIMDTETGELLESIGVAAPDPAVASYVTPVPGGANGPRGGFFTDANTLYTVDFYLWTLDKWEQGTAVDEEVTVPRNFELMQNYPNPFNPSTVIPFAINKEGNVTMTVYNVLGEKVATLINNEKRAAGTYNVHFNASKLATGMYIYKVQFNGQEMSQKMLYVK